MALISVYPVLQRGLVFNVLVLVVLNLCTFTVLFFCAMCANARFSWCILLVLCRACLLNFYQKSRLVYRVFDVPSRATSSKNSSHLS